MEGLTEQLTKAQLRKVKKIEKLFSELHSDNVYAVKYQNSIYFHRLLKPYEEVKDEEVDLIFSGSNEHQESITTQGLFYFD